MTYAEQTFMGPRPYASRRQEQAERPRDRLRAYLRGELSGVHQAKQLATIIDGTPKAAENILAGHWPNDLHFAAIVRRFGRDLLDAVFGPDIDETLARLKQEERQLAKAHHAIRSRRLQVEGRTFGDHEHPEETAAEADGLTEGASS